MSDKVSKLPPLVDNSEHWRARAEEARALASQMSDSGSRRTMLDIAMGYDSLAERAERRTVLRS